MNEQTFKEFKEEVRELIEAIEGEDRRAVVRALRAIYQKCMTPEQRRRQRPDSAERALDPNG